MQTFNFNIGYPNPLSLVPITQPDNWQDLQLETSFENLSPEVVLNSTKLIWKGENAAIMNSWLEGGITGNSNGIFEGIPLQITVCSTAQVVFFGIIDLTDPDTKFSCDIVQVKIRDKRMDMLTQLVDSISFSYLTTIPGQAGFIKPGNITATHGHGDYVPIAYQRNDIPSLESIATLIMILWDIYQIIEEVFNAIENGLEMIIAGSSSYPNIFLMITDYLIATLWFIYAGVLTAILISLTEAAINCLISPVLQKYGMYARTLMQKTCDYFGLQFSSTILNDPLSLYNNTIIMPAKSSWDNNISFLVNILTLGDIKHLNEYDDVYNLDNGGTAYGYYDGTPGDLIRSLEQVFDAEAKITLNTSGQPILNFERWDFQYDLAVYTLPDISDQVPFNSKGLFNSTGRSQSAFGTNADEIIANYGIKYAIDTSDVNTLNSYDGNSCYATTTPANITTQKNVVLKNLKQVNLEFSQVKRKETMTSMEGFFEDAYAVVYAFYVVAEVLTIGILAAANLPSPPLGFNQTGHMLLSGDTTSTPKIFIGGPGQSYTGLSISAWSGRSFTAITIDPNNKGQQNMAFPNLSARSLMKNFHYSHLAVSQAPTDPRYANPYTPGAIRYNQWLIYRDQEIPLCCADYVIIKNNNFIKTVNGLPARADSLKWKPFHETALIDYRVNVPYTKNLYVNFVIDGTTIEYINTI